MKKILVIRLYFLLDALRSNFISCTSNLVYADIYHTSGCRVGIATRQPDVSAHTKSDVQLIKVAPEDGLVQPETCRVFNRKYSLITRILCMLFGSNT